MLMKSIAGATAILLAFAGIVGAAEIKIVSSVAVKGVIQELASQFEHASGNKVIMKFDPGPTVKSMVNSGEAFDVVILAPTLIDDLIKSGKVRAGTATPIARTGVGVAVRAGASKPDVSSSVDAFKRALRTAGAIGLTDPAIGGAASVYVIRLLERLGMTEELKPKIKAYPATAFPKPIIDGETEIWLTQVSEVVQATGIELAGPLPADLQNYTVFTAGVAAGSKDQKTVTDLLKYFTGPSALPVIKARGMEPG